MLDEVVDVGNGSEVEGAQEQVGSAAPEPALRPGWVFTPSIGVSETYDDNITLFGNNEPLNNNDLVSSVGPDASVTYYGRHTRFSTGYGASFSNYRTFSVFDRWNQHAEAEFRRQQNARLEWVAHANGQAVPSTEALEYNGIPFVHTGAQEFDYPGPADQPVTTAYTGTGGVQVGGFFNRLQFAAYLGDFKPTRMFCQFDKWFWDRKSAIRCRRRRSVSLRTAQMKQSGTLCLQA